MSLRALRPALTVFILLLFAPVHAAAAGVLLNGSGSTFIYPIESAWSVVYEKVDSGLRINYQPVGSGKGIGELIQRMTDFAGSDAPLSDQQIKDSPGRILHFPAVLGADVLIYNIPRMPPSAHLRLTGPVLADIFRGKIKKWNDQAILDLNGGLKLPDMDIAPCHRSDGSGTTYIFTDYLSKVSPELSREAGKGTTVKWAVGADAPGNDGVATLVKQTPGAIGYVELTYAVNAELPFAQIRNRAGQWVDANVKTLTVAAANNLANLPADFRASITDASGTGAYPIASYTYFLVYEQQSDRAKGQALKNFLQWVLRDGQTFARALHYAPLPGTVITREEAQIERIKLPAQ
jgi:phosphate transport system substrate-binding protein